MKYYRLVYDYENAKTYASCDVTELGNMSCYAVTEGEPLKDRWNKVELMYDPSNGDVLTDYMDNVYDWLIVSDRFAKLVQQYVKNEVEFLDVDIKNIKTGEMIKGYKVINVIHVVDAMDMDRSVWNIRKSNNTEILSVKKYVLSSEKIGTSNIFILSNDKFPICVSETIKQVILENNLLGFSFWEAEMS